MFSLLWWSIWPFCPLSSFSFRVFLGVIYFSYLPDCIFSIGLPSSKSPKSSVFDPLIFITAFFPPSMILWWDFFSDIYRWLSVSRNSFWLSLQYLSLAPQVGYILIMGRQRDTLFIPNQLPHLLPVLSAPASFQHFWSSLTLPPVFSYLYLPTLQFLKYVHMLSKKGKVSIHETFYKVQLNICPGHMDFQIWLSSFQ